jgi:hypothetical protein
MAEIKLSTKDVKVKVKENNEKGELVDVDKPLREIETELLKSIFTVAFASEKTLKNSILARDCFEQVDSITDAVEKVDLTAEDIQIFSRAWEALDMKPASLNGSQVMIMQRSSLWMKCRALLKQLV